MYKQIDIAVLTNDANGIAEDQTTSGAADLSLDGALVSGGIATTTNSTAQMVAIEGTGNNSGITFTITGTDPNGQAHSEVLTGANSGTATTTAYFITVSTIAASGAVTGNVEAGWLAADGAATQAIVMNWKQTGFNTGLYFDLTAGTMTLSAQFTPDLPDPALRGGTAYTNTYSDDADWRNVDGLSAVTADDESNIAFPVGAIRFIQTVGSATGAATVTVAQGDY